MMPAAQLCAQYLVKYLFIDESLEIVYERLNREIIIKKIVR